MKIKKRFFPGKLLLFGEYAIMKNAKGLSIPYNFYRGIFKFNNQLKIFSNISNKSLKKYANFLEKSQKLGFLSEDLDLLSIHRDLEKGMYFDSNIPQGYGIGSSGALVAAFYENYMKNIILPKKSIKNKNIIFLKKIFSTMESYFHGKSSGIDPLICYLNLPLLIHSSNIISIIDIPKFKKKKGAIFLINSGISTKTSSMIKIFFQKLKNHNFKKLLYKEFIKYNNICIETFLNKKFKYLLKNMKLLSLWIFKNLRQMIPLFLWKIWFEGIYTNNYYLKLCGSGGGGFILGFTSNYELAKKKLKNYQPKVIFWF